MKHGIRVFESAFYLCNIPQVDNPAFVIYGNFLKIRYAGNFLLLFSGLSCEFLFRINPWGTSRLLPFMAFMTAENGSFKAASFTGSILNCDFPCKSPEHFALDTWGILRRASLRSFSTSWRTRAGSSLLLSDDVTAKGHNRNRKIPYLGKPGRKNILGRLAFTPGKHRK